MSFRKNKRGSINAVARGMVALFGSALIFIIGGYAVSEVYGVVYPETTNATAKAWMDQTMSATNYSILVVLLGAFIYILMESSRREPQDTFNY